MRAFVPPRCHRPTRPLAAEAFATTNQQAETALARLSAMAGLVPSVDWLLYSAIRQEALLTSQIEGTQVTLTDLFDDEAGLALANTADVEEVSNCLRAFNHVRSQLSSARGLPISVRLLCDAHRLLLDGVRGTGKQPGELRRSQNWIPGARPGCAVLVPPPPDRVPALLADLERFIHDPAPTLPPLVRVALVHVQFETIHPFLDGVASAAAQAERGIVAVASLINADRRRLLAAPRVGAVALRLFEQLPLMPRFTIDQVQRLDTTFPTATAAVMLL